MVIETDQAVLGRFVRLAYFERCRLSVWMVLGVEQMWVALHFQKCADHTSFADPGGSPPLLQKSQFFLLETQSVTPSLRGRGRPLSNLWEKLTTIAKSNIPACGSLVPFIFLPTPFGGSGQNHIVILQKPVTHPLGGGCLSDRMVGVLIELLAWKRLAA